jgi:pyridoxal phosphate enzyme (YggS family)
MLEDTAPQTSLADRLANVRQRIITSAEQCGRDPNHVKLIAITKTHPPEMVQAGVSLGLTDLGENRVQEAEGKIQLVGRDAARWHLVGHLQANKARKAVALFDFIHSLDSVDLANRLERICVQDERQELPVLIQIKLGGEETKTGIDPNHVPELLAVMKECERVRLVGLMTLPPYFENPDCARPFFKTLRDLRDDLKNQGAFGDLPGELSMGMTHDFEIAIEEGATMVRIGTAIFGERG